MKWIGQHIWDFISRFRSDVYLESLATTTETNVLVVDSAGKVSKSTSVAGDLTSIVAGTGLSGTSLTGPIPTLNADASTSSSAGIIEIAITAEVTTGTDTTRAITPKGLNDGYEGTSNIDTVGTILNGTWRGTPMATGYIADDAITEDKLDNTLLAEIDANTAKDTNVVQTTITGNAGTATLAADATTLATPRAINGVDFDGSAAITVTAAGSTLSDTVTVAKGGTGQTSLAANTVLTGNGTSGIVAESNLTYDGTNLSLSASGTSAPDVVIESTSNHASGGNLIFRKLRADDTPADGDLVGSIIFQGEDDANNAQTYGSIVGVSQETGSGTEGGKIAINVASHDGETNTGLFIVDGSAEDEVDVTIGNGAGSVTTVAGNLDVIGNVLPGITYVKILPSDFVPDDVGRPAMIDDTGSDRWLESHGTAKLFAYVDIPVGFKATHVDVYGSATSAVTVYEADVNSKTVTSKGTGNIGTQINITDVSSDATNYILIELAQASGEEVYGGKLTIAKI